MNHTECHEEREKVTVASEFVTDYLPCIEWAAGLEEKMRLMNEKLIPLIETHTSSPTKDSVAFTAFVSSYNDFIADYFTLNKLLLDFQNSSVAKTTRLLEEYQKVVTNG